MYKTLFLFSLFIFGMAQNETEEEMINITTTEPEIDYDETAIPNTTIPNTAIPNTTMPNTKISNITETTIIKEYSKAELLIGSLFGVSISIALLTLIAVLCKKRCKFFECGWIKKTDKSLPPELNNV